MLLMKGSFSSLLKNSVKALFYRAILKSSSRTMISIIALSAGLCLTLLSSNEETTSKQAKWNFHHKVFEMTMGKFFPIIS